jgi:trehalose 6-phosphate synthase
VVNAVEPVLLENGGVWVASGDERADPGALERNDGILVPPGQRRYRLRRVWLSDEERRDYYDGFANGALWPLCHRTIVAPCFEPAHFARYEIVNRRFADVVAAEATVPAPLVFVQDYHFALLPASLRRQLPLARIATFWHIPWPAPMALERCPWSDALIKGLLGSTLIGLQTNADLVNFLSCAESVADVDWDERTVTLKNRTVRAGVYPASVDAPANLCASVPPVSVCRQEIRRALRLREDTILGVGVDRLDYTKGLEEKFLAVERLLDNRPDLRGRFVFVQIAQPCRDRLPAYQRTRDRVSAVANRVNARFSDHAPPIVLLPTAHDRATVLRFLRAADLCYVGSLHDGMNLVSKEFVAARDDERGVLVLSVGAGASQELRDALLVNPCHIGQVADALAAAIDMPVDAQRSRLQRLRRVIEGWDAQAWATHLLRDVMADVRRGPATGRALHHEPISVAV